MVSGKIPKNQCRSGLTLADTMISTTVLIVAVIGTSAMRYNATLDTLQSCRIDNGCQNRSGADARQ